MRGPQEHAAEDEHEAGQDRHDDADEPDEDEQRGDDHADVVGDGVHLSRSYRRPSGLHEALALVVDLGQADEGGDVLTAVVRAEQRLSTGVEGGADVGLGAAAVATVRGGQGWCQCGVHVGPPRLARGSARWFVSTRVDGWRCNSQPRRMLPSVQVCPCGPVMSGS